MTRWELRRGVGWLLLGALFVVGSLGVRSLLAPDGSAATRPDTPPVAGASAPAQGSIVTPPRTAPAEPGDAATDPEDPSRVDGHYDRSATPQQSPPSQADRAGEAAVDPAALAEAEAVAAAWVTEYATTDPDESAADYRARLEAHGSPELVEAVTSAEALEEARPSLAVAATVTATQPVTVDEERIAVLVTARLDGDGMLDVDHELTVIVVPTENGYRVAEVVL